MKMKILHALMIYCSIVIISGCATPNVAVDLQGLIGTPFTNPQSKTMNVFVGNRYTLLAPLKPIYHKKELEGSNIRYYIDWLRSGKCSYSLLVGPDDIILSWRNEGPTHVSKCTYS
jgi:hypothetical protein